MTMRGHTPEQLEEARRLYQLARYSPDLAEDVIISIATSLALRDKRITRPFQDFLKDILGESGKGQLTVRDLAYTAFQKAKDKNDEDGGPTDWFTDTRPIVENGIELFRKRVPGGDRENLP
jgi:hypothetical protein